MPAAAAAAPILAVLALSCARQPAETQAFPVPARAAAPEAACPPGWRFVNVERDDSGAVVRVICRRVP